MKVGLTYTSKVVVDTTNTAVALGSGTVSVFATPAMIALMENAAMNAVSSHLPDGCDTVGTEIYTTHIKATPVGAEVQAIATLVKIEGRKLHFEVAARDSRCGEIGRGSHTRVLVETEKFLSKLK